MNLFKKIAIPQGMNLLMPLPLKEERVVDSTKEVEIWKLLFASIAGILDNKYVLPINSANTSLETKDTDNVAFKDGLTQEVLEIGKQKYLVRVLHRKVTRNEFQLSMAKYFNHNIEIIRNCLSHLNSDEMTRMNGVLHKLIFDEINSTIEYSVENQWFLDDFLKNVYFHQQYRPDFECLMNALRDNKLTHKFKYNYNEEFKFIVNMLGDVFFKEFKKPELAKYKQMGHDTLEIMSAIIQYNNIIYIFGFKESIEHEITLELDLKEKIMLEIKKYCSDFKTIQEEYLTLKQNQVVNSIEKYLKLFKRVKEKNGEFDVESYKQLFQYFSDNLLSMFYTDEKNNYKLINSLMVAHSQLSYDLVKTYGDGFKINLDKYKSFKDVLLKVENQNTVSVSEDFFKIVKIALNQKKEIKNIVGNSFDKELSKNCKFEIKSVSSDVKLSLIDRVLNDEINLLNDYKIIDTYVKETGNDIFKEDLKYLLMNFKKSSSLAKGLVHNIEHVFKGLNIEFEWTFEIKEKSGVYSLFHRLEFKKLQYPIGLMKNIMWDMTLNNFEHINTDSEEYNEIIGIYQKHLMNLDKKLTPLKSKLKKF